MKPIPLFALLPIAFLATAPVAYAAPPAQSTTQANEIMAMYDRVIALAAKGQKGNAVALCRQILAKAPNAAPVWATMARLLSQQNNNTDAIAAGKKAVNLAPKEPAFRADLADYYLRTDNTKQAEYWAKSALETAPKNDVALSVLTTIRLKARNYKEAIPLLNRLQAVRGGMDRAIAQNLVSAYANLKDKKGALKAAQAYSQKSPRDAEAVLAVIDLAFETENIPVATAYVTKLGKIVPNSPLPSYYQGRLIMANDKIAPEARLVKAEPIFQKAVNLVPDYPEFRLRLAATQFGQGAKKWSDARTNFAAAILYANHDARARLGMASLDVLEKEWDDAVVQYAAYMQLVPDDNKRRREYAGVLRYAKQNDESYAQMNELAKRLPKDTNYLKELASWQQEDKNPAAARATYEKVLERTPKDYKALLGMAQCYIAENRARNARAVFDRAIEADPQKEDSYLLLAQLYLDNGEKQPAIETLERAIKANPGANRARWQLIEQYIAAKRDDDARREIGSLTLRAEDPNRNQYRLAAGNLFMIREKYPEAVTEFERIEREEQDNPAVLYALASAYDKAGRATDAAKTYERAATAAEKLLLLPVHHKNQQLRDILKAARTAQKKPEQAEEFLKKLDATE